MSKDGIEPPLGAMMSELRRSILVVEDDAILADNIRVYLERNQWDVFVAHSAEDGLRAMSATDPDLVLTDYRLPGLSGLAMIQDAVVTNSLTKIIMLTGEAMLDELDGAMKARLFACLEKPVSLEHLNAVLTQALTQTR